MNKQNHRFWDSTNIHWSRDQTAWSVNMWCGLIDGILLGSYFYDGTLTGRRYLNFLVNQLPLLFLK